MPLLSRLIESIRIPSHSLPLLAPALASESLLTEIKQAGYTSPKDFLRQHGTLIRYGILITSSGDIVQGPYWNELMEDEVEVYRFG